MNRSLVLALLLVVSIVGGGLLVLSEQQNHYDPLAEFRTPDGKFSFPGGKLTKELQNLLFPPPAPKDYTTYSVDLKSSRPTMEIKGTIHFYPISVKTYSYADSIEAGSGAFASVWRGLQSAWNEIRDFAESLSPFETASAACTGGACFWVGGTGNFSDGTHWSLTTGGANCACTPAATDTVTFDASSGAGTATQNNATFTSGAATLTNSSVSVSGSTNTWKTSGNWLDANFHFAPATSTLEFTASAQVTTAGTAGTAYFYNLTVDSSVVLTTKSIMGVGNILNFPGSPLGSVANDGTPRRFDVCAASGCGTNEAVTPTAGPVSITNQVLYRFISSGKHVAGGTYYSLVVFAVSGNQTATLGGNVTTTGNSSTVCAGTATTFSLEVCGAGTATITTLNTDATNNYSITITDSNGLKLGVVSNTTYPGILIANNSTISITLFTTNTNANSYVQFGGSTWTVSSTWTNDTTNSSWSAGTGTVTFTSATGGTMTFAGANLSAAEFNNVTFTSSAGTAQTFTMATRNLRIGGTLTVTDSSSTTTLNSSNLNLQANDVEVGASGTILIGTGDFVALTTFNIDGSLTMDTIVVSNMFISRTAGTGTFTITAWTAWAAAPDVDVRWTFNPSVAGDTLQFVLEDVSNGANYVLKRDAITVDTKAAVGTTVTFSVTAGWSPHSMAIDELATTPCTTYFWVGGTGSWSDNAHWASTSGGTNACSTYPNTSSSDAVFDTNSGSGTSTLNVAGIVGNLTIGGSVALSAGANTMAVSGNWNSTTGTFIEGTSIVTMSGTAKTVAINSAQRFAGLTITGTISETNSLRAGALTISAGSLTKNTNTLSIDSLTMSGGDLFSTSGDVSVGTFVNISSASSAISFGSENWVVGTTWTNQSTDGAVWNTGTGTITLASGVSTTVISATPLAEQNTSTYDAFGVSDLAPDGTIYYIYRQGSSHVGPGDYGIARMIKSTNGGLTWSSPVTIASESGVDIRKYEIGILSNGRIVFAYGRYNPDTATTLSMVSIYSDNGGSTWSSPTTLTVGGGLNTDFGPYGRIVLINSNQYILAYFGNVGTTWQVRVQFSTDGATWGTDTLVGTATGGDQLTESSIAWLGGDNIVIMSRINNVAAMRQFKSTNNGVSWTSQGNTTFNAVAPVIVQMTTASRQYALMLYWDNNVMYSVLGRSGDLIANGPSAWDTANKLIVVATGLSSAYQSVILPAGQTRALVIYDLEKTASDRDVRFTQFTVQTPWTMPATTFTFAGTNLGKAEFNNVIFASSIYTMATRGLWWAGTLTASSLGMNTQLVTGGLNLTGGALVISDYGILTASTSTVSVSNVTATGSISNTIALTSGAWTVAGNWNTSGTGTTFTAGTSTVTMNGTAKTVALRNSSNGFNNLTVSGTVTANSFVWATSTLLVSGTLTKTGQSIVFVTLTDTSGTIVDGAISVTNFSVSNSATNQTTISVFTTWTANTTYKWTDTISAGTDTFNISGVTQTRFSVLKDGAPFITGASVVANTITFTMTSGDPVIEVDAFSSVTCTTYFWVGGTGVWSDFATHWVSTSGGVTPCDAYPNTSTSNVVFDANSGVGTVTVDVNPTIGTMTLGGSITLSAGAHTITVNGNWTRTSTFTAGTSTIVFATTALIASTMDGANAFYNLTINLGATVTTTNSGQSSIEVNNVLTVNGTLDFTGNTAFRVLHLNNVASSSNPLVMGASGLITSSEAEGGGPNDSLLSFADLSSFANNPATVNIPAGKYYNISFEIGGKAGGGTINYQATGTWATNTNPLTGKTDKGAYVWMNSVNGALTLTTGANTINVSGIQNSAGANAEGVLSNGGTVNLIASATGYAHQALGGGGSGYGTCNCPMPVNFYIQFGSGIWNVDGDWSSISTSVNWSAGTGTINFTSNTASGYTVQHIGDATGTKNIFFTLTASGTASKLLSTPLTASNSFTLTSTTFDTGSNTLTLGAVTVAVGGVLVANASAIAVSGNWTSTAGTFTAGTSTVTFTASANMALKNGVDGFYNMVVNPSVTVTNTGPSSGDTNINNVLTVNGSVAMGSSNRFLRFRDVLGSTDPLVFGVSGSITGLTPTTSGGLYFRTEAGSLINIPAKVYTNMRILFDPQNIVAGDGVEYRLAGASTFDAIEGTFTQPAFFNTQTFDVTITGGRADNDVLPSGTLGIKVTSGTWSVSGGVNVSSASAYIQFGTSAWTVGKNYTSASTSASWNQGTATLHFTGASQTYSQGTKPLYDITFDSGANYVVTGSVYIKNLHVVGTMTMNGFAVTAFDMTTNVGLMTIDIWQKFNRGSATDVRWHFDPDTGTTTITIMQGGVQPLTTYSLYRDTTDIQQSLSDGSGKVTFSVAGGWSPHSMVIAPPGGVPPNPGGGGGGSGTTNPTWDWEVIGDWTVRFTVTTKVENATYEWIVTGKVVGSGEEFVYMFPRTGNYDVTMRASRDGAVFSETTKTVTVAALSFFAMNFVMIVLIAVGAVFIVMTPGYKSAIGKLLSFVAGAGFLFGALQLSSFSYASPNYTSPAGIEIIGGAALLMGSALVGRKSKGFALLMFLAGLGLVVYAISTLF